MSGFCLVDNWFDRFCGGATIKVYGIPEITENLFFMPKLPYQHFGFRIKVFHW